MSRRWNAFSSSVAEKLLIALTGLALFLYLVVHLIGNTLLFFGPKTFNGYAHMLISNPLIIPIEIGLAAIFVVHVYKTVVMWWRNRQARPDGYQNKKWAGPPSRKSVASSTMIYTGALTALFIGLHVKTFKYGAYYQVAGTEERDLFRVVTEIFHNPAWVIFYEVALVLLGLHLWHGFASAVESLGGDEPRYTPSVLRLGKILAVVIGGGFVFIPLWVFFLGGRS